MSVVIPELIDKLLLERISSRGIARVVGVSWRWLQNYVNEKFEKVPRQVKVSDKSKGRLTIECDELWSFVDRRNNKYWVFFCNFTENLGLKPRPLA